MWRHPKYYKELRKLRNKEARSVPGCLPTNELHNSDQAISDEASTEATSVRPGSGQSGKLQAVSDERQAASDERQATSEGKLQATSSKSQASE
jgi:hypothetical protein